MTVSTLLATISSREISEWIAFYQLEKEEKLQPPRDVEGSLRSIFGRPQ